MSRRDTHTGTPWRRLVAAAVAVCAVCAVLALGAGDALAHWTAGGTGTGVATTGSAAAVTLTPGAPDTSLYPGGQADVMLTITNPNTTAVQIGSVAPDPSQGTNGFAVDAPHASCGLDALTVTAQTNGGHGWIVPAAVAGTAGSLAVTLPDSIAMAAGAADACQGAQFTVYLVAGR